MTAAAAFSSSILVAINMAWRRCTTCVRGDIATKFHVTYQRAEFIVAMEAIPVPSSARALLTDEA